MMPEQRTRQIIDDYFHDHALKLANVTYTSNMPAIIELVSMSYCVSFIFEFHLCRRAESLSLDCFSFGEVRVVSDFMAAYRKGGYISHYKRDFIVIARHARNTASKGSEFV